MGINTMWPFLGGRSKNEHEPSESCANAVPNYTPAPAEQTDIPASEEVANPVAVEEELPVAQPAEVAPAVEETTTELTPADPTAVETVAPVAAEEAEEPATDKVVYQMADAIQHELYDTIKTQIHTMMSPLNANLTMIQQTLNQLAQLAQQQNNVQQVALNNLQDKVENVVEAQELTIQKQHNAALKFQEDVIYKTQKNLIMELIGISDNIRMIIQSAETEADYDLLGAIKDLNKWVDASLSNNSVRKYEEAASDPMTMNRKRQQLVDKETTNVAAEHNTYKTVSPGYEWSIPYLVVNADVQLNKILEENRAPQLFSYVIRPEEIVKLEYKETKNED
jgi:hypothetical protein